MAAPTKAEREKCWVARDSFWKCLDNNENNADKCKTQRQQFEGSCSTQWLKYFDRRRDYLKYQEKIEKEGFEPITDSNKTSS